MRYHQRLNRILDTDAGLRSRSDHREPVAPHLD
ncbi:hypothetical protein [Williamsia sterculiae]|nr:hypothetical protein [Williamsia sterculiae]